MTGWQAIADSYGGSDLTPWQRRVLFDLLDDIEDGRAPVFVANVLPQIGVPRG